jgi:hypothetical protein
LERFGVWSRYQGSKNIRFVVNAIEQSHFPCRSVNPAGCDHVIGLRSFTQEKQGKKAATQSAAAAYASRTYRQKNE